MPYYISCRDAPTFYEFALLTALRKSQQVSILHSVVREGISFKRGDIKQHNKSKLHVSGQRTGIIS